MSLHFNKLVDSPLDVPYVFGHCCSGEPTEGIPKKGKRLFLVCLLKFDMHWKKVPFAVVLCNPISLVVE